MTIFRSIVIFLFLISFCLFQSLSVAGQILDITPPFPTVDDDVTIIYNAAAGNGALVGVTPVYAHAGLITSESSSDTDWQNVQGNWGTADDNVLMTDLGGDLHEISYNIQEFYGVDGGTEINQFAFVFRNADGSSVGRSADGSDIYYEVYPADAGLLCKIFAPDESPVLEEGENFDIVAKSNELCTLTLLDDGIEIASALDADELNFNLTASGSGTHMVEFIADNGNELCHDTLYYTINPPLNYENPPVGMDLGLNYLSETSVLLKLYAPEKQNVYVLGDFNDFEPHEDYYMNISEDETTWWLEITGLTPGVTYGYQYLIDGTLRLSDPLSELIADPNNDQWIDNFVYPDPYPYPSSETSGFVSLFEVGADEFEWQNDNYEKPAKENLIIYELLVRDFLLDHSYITLRDTLDYLDSLGINAIELMPVGEFENNESWGYNPSFHMALDKYYGTPEHFKMFVDECHSRGIAVILDIALNHLFGQSPLVNMYWEGDGPAANSPWINQICPHEPFCWGYDLNHEVQPTRDYVDRVNRHWLNEYHVDGFRFDYTKGFVNSSAGFSDTRIDILKNMADSLWVANPDAYVILEHWADNSEEIILSDYGMLLWGNVSYNYHEAMKGWGNNNISSGIYSNRDWNYPHLITYVESHDEERGVFGCLEYGNTSNNLHNVQDTLVAIARSQAAAVLLLTTPGPKMIWQFGELGYDVSIDYLCRVCNKPILWYYYDEFARNQLYKTYKSTLNLRNNYPTFQSLDFDYALVGSVKRIRLNHEDMNAVVLTNFNVEEASAYPVFQHDGWWYEYFSGDSILVEDVNAQLPMGPADFRIYTDVFVQATEEVSTVGVEEFLVNAFDFELFPVPASDYLTIRIPDDMSGNVVVRVIDNQGKLVIEQQQGFNAGKADQQLDIRSLPAGTYHMLLQTERGFASKVFVINR